MVKLVRTSGKSVGQVSKELELTETALRAWVQRADIDEKKDPAGPLTSDERAEVTRLRRELRTVTMERDFLRKGAAFFAFNSNGIPLDAIGTFGAFDDETPALAVGTLGRDTEPTVFLEYQVDNPANADLPVVQISKALFSQIGSTAGWGTPALFPAAPDSISVFHPALALDPVANVLDALVLETQPASSPAATIINTFWARFDPTQLGATPLGPQSLPTNAPTVADLPAREPFTVTQNAGTRFTGEYNGLAVQGETPVFAYLERPLGSIYVTRDWIHQSSVSHGAILQFAVR